jgi:tetratricopeptide (TPR) repeat protein
VSAQKGDYEAALASANDVLAHDSTECDALVANSSANRGLRKWAAALQSGQRAAAECPEQVAAWLATTLAYDGLGRPSGTERVYSQAFDAHPQDLRIARSYSDWLLRQNRAREAVAIARRLTVNAPASMAAWEYYGDVCRRTQSGCESDAVRGLQDARTRFGVDLPIGAQAPNTLFGRFVSR